MYEKALVPLDGSELAECALSHVMNLVKKGVVEEIILLEVIDIPSVLLEEGFDLISLKNGKSKKQISISMRFKPDSVLKAQKSGHKSWRAIPPIRSLTTQRKRMST